MAQCQRSVANLRNAGLLNIEGIRNISEEELRELDPAFGICAAQSHVDQGVRMLPR